MNGIETLTGMRVKNAVALITMVFVIILYQGQDMPCAAGHDTEPDPVAAVHTRSHDMGDLGRFDKWQEIEITLAGPESQGSGNPNPFAIYVDANFTSPTGRKYRVPGFYNGDGRGGINGSVWVIRFSADETGTWKFATESENSYLDSYTGSFSVNEPQNEAPEFYRWGRLEAVGTPTNKVRYLKFRDGPYWLKAGCDDPENFLGGYENYNTPEKRKAAIRYLADKGINSMYIMTHNLDGDDRDVWPWLGKSAREARANSSGEVRFDIARLEEWHQLFVYMQSEGVVLYLVLEDDSAWKGYDHPRYYREIVARFGTLPALIFNFNEEHNENYSLSEALDHVQTLADLDPYNHPRGIHNVNSPDDQYIDAPQVDFTSIQTNSDGDSTVGALKHNKLVIDWISRCASRGKRILMVGVDEGRPEENRMAWWSAYTGGGVWEAHVISPYDQPMSAREPVWTQLGGTRAFMESLPFWEMQPHNEVVSSGEAFCLAKPGEVYALYLPSGGEIGIELPEGGNYEYAWWRPDNGRDGQFESPGNVSGGQQTLKAPDQGDWAVRIARR